MSTWSLASFAPEVSNTNLILSPGKQSKNLSIVVDAPGASSVSSKLISLNGRGGLTYAPKIILPPFLAAATGFKVFSLNHSLSKVKSLQLGT